VAFVAAAHADAALDALRGHPLGVGARIIGTVTDEHPGTVVGRTAFGGTRVLSRPLGEQLPRIC
jgi:hydrogenase expression/formation protein HypE